MTSHLQVGDRQRPADVPPLAAGRRPVGAVGRTRVLRGVRVLQRAATPRPRTTWNGRPTSPREEAGLAYGRRAPTRAYLAYHRGDYDVALECAQEAAGIARAAGNEALALRTSVVMAARRPRAGTRRLPRASHGGDRGRPGRAGWTSWPRPGTRTSATSTSSIGGSAPPNACWSTHWSSRSSATSPSATTGRPRSAPGYGSCEGRWSAAMEDADDALGRSGMPLATLWPHLVSGLVSMRRDGGGSRPPRSGVGPRRTAGRAAAAHTGAGPPSPSGIG